MKIRWEYEGGAFEYERKPMSKGRFRSVCGILALAMATAVVVALAVTGAHMLAAAVAVILTFFSIIAAAIAE